MAVRISYTDAAGRAEVLSLRDDQFITAHLDDGPVVLLAAMVQSVLVEDDARDVGRGDEGPRGGAVNAPEECVCGHAHGAHGPEEGYDDGGPCLVEACTCRSYCTQADAEGILGDRYEAGLVEGEAWAVEGHERKARAYCRTCYGPRGGVLRVDCPTCGRARDAPCLCGHPPTVHEGRDEACGRCACPAYEAGP